MILKMRMTMMIKHNDMVTDGNVEVDIDTGNGDAVDDSKDEDDSDNAIDDIKDIMRRIKFS